MARPADALKQEVIPSWSRFIGEVLATGMASRAARAANEANEGSAFALGSAARALRRVANGDIYPNPEALWGAAEAARHLPNRAWCAGPLVLFAAGRFELFATMMLAAPQTMVPLERKRQLLSSTARAVEPTVDDANFEPIYRELIANGANELTIKRHMKKFFRRPTDVVAGDRAVWLLTAMEEAGFDLAWERRSAFVPSAATVTARLAERNADVGLKMQRDIAIAAVRDALRESTWA